MAYVRVPGQHRDVISTPTTIRYPHTPNIHIFPGDFNSGPMFYAPFMRGSQPFVVQSYRHKQNVDSLYPYDICYRMDQSYGAESFMSS